jgi:hypothetical protein
MDLFWLIPAVAVGFTFLCGFCAYIMLQPTSPSTPQVLVDKPADEPSTEQAAKVRDWSGRPCGSYLDWLSDGGQ